MEGHFGGVVEGEEVCESRAHGVGDEDGRFWFQGRGGVIDVGAELGGFGASWKRHLVWQDDYD